MAFWTHRGTEPLSVVASAAPSGLRGAAKRRLKRLAAESALRVAGPPKAWTTPPPLAGLCFHHIVTSRAEATAYYDPWLLTSATYLDRQMELVSRWFNPVPAEPEAAATPCGAVVAFDDAFRSVAQHATPTLRRWRIPAVAFVNDSTTNGGCLWHDVIAATCPDNDAARRRVAELKNSDAEAVERAVEACGGRSAGPRDLYMSWDELRSWIDAGMSVGGHSSRHYILVHLDDDTLRDEIRTNRSIISRKLGVIPVAFAYPNGEHDGRVREAVRDAGYMAAFEIEDQDGPDGPFTLPRRNICDAMCTDERGRFSPALFLAEITGLLRGVQWS